MQKDIKTEKLKYNYNQCVKYFDFVVNLI